MTSLSANQSAASTQLSQRQLRWALGLMLVANAFNFMDRQLFAVLQSDVKRDLGLTDLQLGIVQGPTFAIFFSVMALPIARLAERYSRKWIFAISVGVWSVFAALCGTANNFVQIALYRIGLAAGEAGCTPTAHSLIGDYFPPERRARALSIFTSGLCLGVFTGALFSGLIAQTWGWRAAFIIIGAPGLLLAGILAFALPEPQRGQSEPEGSLHYKGATQAASFADVLRYIGQHPTVIWVIIAHTFASYYYYGVNAFTPSYFIRHYSFTTAEVGVLTAIAAGLFGGIATIFSGWLTERRTQGNPEWFCLLPIVALTLSIPCSMGMFLIDHWGWAAAGFMLSQLLFWTYVAPIYSLLNLLMPPRMRATTSALLLVISGGIGGALGPLAVGMISDAIAAAQFGVGEYLELCRQSPLPAALKQSCHIASSEGLRWSLLLCASTIILVIASLMMAYRTVRRDMGMASDTPTTV